MREFLLKVKDQFLKSWQTMKLPQKIIFIFLLSVIVITLCIAIYIYSKPQMVTILKELDLKDVAKVRDFLQKEGYKVDIGDDNKSILVLRDQTKDALADLASQDLVPGANIVGLEIFDKIKFGQTDYERRINLIRGITGELERVLRKFPHVKDANVEIPLVEESIYTDKQQRLTASVTLFLDPADFKLSSKQISGIKRLISASIAGLNPEDVAVFDQESVELIPRTDDEEEAIAVSKVPLRLQIQNREANRLKREIEDHLGKALSRDKVEVMVKVEMLWDKISKESEIKDLPQWMQPKFGGQPIQLKVSSLEKNEKLRGEGVRPEGEPGLKPNEPVYKFVNEKGEVVYESHEKRDNFMDPSVFKEIMEKAADFRRITASVIIDGDWKKTVTKDNKIERKYLPRSDEFLKDIKEIVMGAIGADESRGDVVYVKCIPFDRSKQFEIEESELKKHLIIKQSIIWAFIITVFLFITTMVFRELGRRRRIREEELARLRELERQKAIAEQGPPELTLEEQERLELVKRAEAMAKQKPEMVANLIRTWLQADMERPAIE
ncbi:MAG: flagellar basal-body MS-ring/collar protein FliF [Candidatus Hydrogenedentota bacterium]